LLLASGARAIEPRDDRAEQRSRYVAALSLLDDGRTQEFEAAARALEQYPLYPYLDFEAHRRRLALLTASDVKSFRERWKDTPVAQRLYDAWLDNLADRGNWAEFVKNYEPSTDVARTCRYLRALVLVGRRSEATDAVESLWAQPRSQPEACTPLFDTWIASRHLTEATVWTRLTLSANKGEMTLARSLLRYLKGPSLKDANALLAMASRPAAVEDTTQFHNDSPRVRDIVAFGLTRLAHVDPDAAARAWNDYEQRLHFDPIVARRIDQDITRFLARRNVLTLTADLSPSPDDRQLDTAEALVVAAVGLERYPEAIAFIDALKLTPDQLKGDPRWLYWRGRAKLAMAEPADPPDDLIALANERQYYGFMAASRIGAPLKLNAKAVPSDPEADAALYAKPGMQRIEELYALDQKADARREWQMLLPTLDPRERIVAIEHLAEMGWIDQSVKASFDQELSDYLSIRFPYPYRNLFDGASDVTGLPLSFLYGIARQESAFGPTAQSPVGALGLMQLMPATAARTARSIGDRAPQRSDLFRADVNLRYGSRYLAMLMKRYNGNRYLAAAAYNAGEDRVDHWLAERPIVSADLWIESIPFTETKNYVKQVLAFTYIYGQLLGAPTPFLTSEEH